MYIYQEGKDKDKRKQLSSYQVAEEMHSQADKQTDRQIDEQRDRPRTTRKEQINNRTLMSSILDFRIWIAFGHAQQDEHMYNHVAN